jgi:Zn-dependent protease with chaperone function
VSTQFFERQETQRSHTRWLVFAFIAAFLLVTGVIALVIVIGTEGNPLPTLRHHPGYFISIAVVLAVVMLFASWHKSSQLRAGGAVVARALGGVPVIATDSDPKRKRLLNIVEEMAIAARIRKPQVYVLPEEQGINAFAAGHSPDEAAVAVTQGALDSLDREQLQAVIGHEFSHVLNGDMKLNMSLTAWIFGLFFVTDIAVRVMRARARGKSAGRIKAIAFGVFAAGSAGLVVGRLLQAAVSRRREHLADASSVQFTRNPQALQGAFVAMAAHPEGSRLANPTAFNYAHMLFAHSDAAWAQKTGTTWFSTHPTLEERVQALDARITSVKFRAMISDERRKVSARNAQATAPDAPAAVTAAAAAPIAAAAPPAPVYLDIDTQSLAALPAASIPVGTAALVAAAPVLPVAAAIAVAAIPAEAGGLALAETLPSGIRTVAGRSPPPDVLRNRLSQEQQNSIINFVAQTEQSSLSVQATYVATMLADEPAKWRMQLTRLAPLLGVQLFKSTPQQIARIAELAPAARLPMLIDLLPTLDGMDPADRKRLRAVARAFATTVATGDMLRFAVTRILEKKLAKAVEPPPPVPLPERAAEVCRLYAALSQCRFGAGKQGQNAYRAGLMGMLTPQKWSPYPEILITPAELDATLAAISQLHPTGKRSFSEGLARVIAVGGRLTVPQVDLLRVACLVTDCGVPPLPVDVVFEEADTVGQASQASAR